MTNGGHDRAIRNWKVAVRYLPVPLRVEHLCATRRPELQQVADFFEIGGLALIAKIHTDEQIVRLDKSWIIEVSETAA